MGPELEGEFGTQLDRARIAHHRDRPKETGGYVGAAKSLEVGVIENVERLGPQLQPHRLTDADVLAHRKVKTGGGRTINDASTSVADDVCDTGCGDGRVGLEARRVEVLLDRVRRVCIRIAKDVRQAAGNQSRNEAQTGGVKG